MNRIPLHILLSAGLLSAFTTLAIGQTGSKSADKVLNIFDQVEKLGAKLGVKPSAPEAPAAAAATTEQADQAPGARAAGAKLDLGSDPAQADKAVHARAEPDLVDLKLGMSPKAAADALAKRYPAAIRKAARVRWEAPAKADFVGGLMAIEAKEVKHTRITHGEYVLLTLAAPPNQPAVLGIKRTVVFAQGQESNRQEWVKSLEGKYGRATVRQGWRGANTDSDDVVQLTWYFDKARPGDPKASSGPLSTRCGMLNDWSRRMGMKFESHFDDKVVARLADGDLGNTFTGWRDASKSEESIGFCGRVLQVDFEVKRAGPGDRNSPFISRVDMTLTDHDSAAAAARKTNALLAGAANKAATERVEQSKQNKPTL